MLNAIEGFSQLAVIEFCTSGGIWLDVIDLVILRWFVIMRGLSLMERLSEDGDEYVWIAYQLVIDHIPLLGLRTTDAAARRFAKYVKAGLLKQLIRRLGKGRGCKTFYAPTDKLRDLFIKKDNTLGYKTESKVIHSDEKCRPDPDEKSDQSKKKRKEKKGESETLLFLKTAQELHEKKTGVPLVLNFKKHGANAKRIINQLGYETAKAKLAEYYTSPDDRYWFAKDGNRSIDTFFARINDINIQKKSTRKKLWCPKCQTYEESTSVVCLTCHGDLQEKSA
jgi:hypothetical protein